MIRHRPFGSGHPYAADTEQRSPEFPAADDTYRLGVRTSPGIRDVECELALEPSDGPQTTETLRLEPVVRSDRGRTLDGGHLASAQARLAREHGGWSVEAGPLPREVSRVRYRFTAHRSDGTAERTRWFEFRPAAWVPAPDAVTEIGRARVIRESVEVLHDGQRARRIRFDLPLAETEHVTGFGERYDLIDQSGEALDAAVFEQYKSQGAGKRTYLPMPFAHVVGGTGWGFHVRTSRRTWFDIGRTHPGRLRVEAELDAPADDLSGLIEISIYDGTPTEVLAAFLADVGAPTELPDWMFRLWASGNEWNTQAEVMRQADLHREHGIPVGSIVIEAWSDESTFTAFRDAAHDDNPDGAPMRLADFRFPVDGAWPAPKAMVEELHARDIRVHLWQIPLIKTRPHPTGLARAIADAAVRDHVLIREPRAHGGLRPYRNRGWWFPLALMPDLTDNRAADWWTARRRYLVDEVGIDGFKTDGGEHAWGRELVYLDDSTGDEKNNTFPVAYASAYGRLLESAGKAPVTFSRSGFAGSQAHGAFWAGDENSTWEAFRWSMIAGLNAAACGILYWGWDLAGFSGEIPSAELYLRAAAASTFIPIFQYHSEFNHHRTPSRDRTPWNIAERHHDARVIPIFRELAQLRERLVPYLAEQARVTIATGRPLMRPMYFDHPDEPWVWSAPIQWMLGDSLLVAPVLKPGAEHAEVRLPAGDWVDVWTGTTYEGGSPELVPAPIDRTPVFATSDAWPTLSSAFDSWHAYGA